jgi:hypothetical protein
MYKLILVSSTVCITLFTAILLNYGAKNSTFLSLSGVGIIALVVFINFMKFKLWGTIYRRYHLSESYPLVALFFPLIYFVAIISNEAEFDTIKILGIFLILIGIRCLAKG